MRQLTSALAREILDASLAKASEIGVPMSVAVCDEAGHMSTFARMDDCMLLAVETVQAKARTAVYFRRPTSETVERSVAHPTVYTTFVEVSTAPIVMSMGGFPLWDGTHLAGGVAAAGGTGAEDAVVAAAGVEVWHEATGQE